MLCLQARIEGSGSSAPGAWTEQSQVVVETVTKTSTTQQYQAGVPQQKSDASKVVTQGAGLHKAMVNKETTFTVDASQAGT